MYEKQNRLDSAEDIFERDTQLNYKAVDHLANIWCEWGRDGAVPQQFLQGY
jgi:pre-mRNA-splicing factor SYF1